MNWRNYFGRNSLHQFSYGQCTASINPCCIPLKVLPNELQRSLFWTSGVVLRQGFFSSLPILKWCVVLYLFSFLSSFFSFFIFSPLYSLFSILTRAKPSCSFMSPCNFLVACRNGQFAFHQFDGSITGMQLICSLKGMRCFAH